MQGSVSECERARKSATEHERKNGRACKRTLSARQEKRAGERERDVQQESCQHV